MTVYIVRPGFTIQLNNTNYLGGDLVDLNAEQFQAHKHKLQGVDGNILPIIPSNLFSFDDTNTQLGANTYQNAIAALDIRLDTAEVNFAALGNAPANSLKGRLSGSGLVQDLSKSQVKTLLDMGSGYYKGVAPYPYIPSVGDIWQELNVNGQFIEQWFWNGIYWLSTNKYSELSGFTNLAATSSFRLLPTQDNLSFFNIFLVSTYLRISVVGPNNNTTYWNFQLQRFSNTLANVFTNVGSPILTQNLSGATLNIRQNLNLHIDLVSVNSGGFSVNYSRINNPGPATGNFILFYRRARL